VFAVQEHNVVRRLIMLIDVIYDSGVHLVWSGEVEPKQMFTDMFIKGKSNLKINVESDDLTPFDPRLEEELTRESRTAAFNEIASSPKVAGSGDKPVHHIKHNSHHHMAESINVGGKQADIAADEAVDGPGDDSDDADSFHIMKGETAAFRDLDFAVRRAISRLIEMSGKQYMESNRKNNEN
jgi:predicted ATPase